MLVTKGLQRACISAVAGVFLAVSLFGPAYSETVGLQQAYQKMRDGGLDAGIIDAELMAAAERVRQAKGQRYPRVELTVGYDNITQEVLSSDNTAYATGKSRYPKQTVSLTISQPIYDAVRFRALPLEEAKNAVSTARALSERNRVVRDMIVAYLGVAQAELRVKRAKAIVSARKSFADSIEEEIDAGRRESDSLYRAQSDILSAQGDEMNSEIGLAETLAELQRFTGPEVSGVSSDPSRIAVVNLASIEGQMSEDRLIELSPDVQIARAALEVANRQRHSVKGKMLPRFDAVLGFSRDKTEGSLFGGGSETQALTAGVRLTVPIYEGGIKRSELREADISIKASELKIQRTERLVRARYGALMKAARSSAERSRRLANQRRLSEDSLDVAKEQFEAGRTSQGALLEQQLRRDTLLIDLQMARLQQLRIQAELFALFGALDIQTFSQQAGS